MFKIVQMYYILIPEYIIIFSCSANLTFLSIFLLNTYSMVFDVLNDLESGLKEKMNYFRVELKFTLCLIFITRRRRAISWSMKKLMKGVKIAKVEQDLVFM